MGMTSRRATRISVGERRIAQLQLWRFRQSAHRRRRAWSDEPDGGAGDRITGIDFPRGPCSPVAVPATRESPSSSVFQRSSVCDHPAPEERPPSLVIGLQLSRPSIWAPLPAAIRRIAGMERESISAVAHPRSPAGEFVQQAAPAPAALSWRSRRSELSITSPSAGQQPLPAEAAAGVRPAQLSEPSTSAGVVWGRRRWPTGTRLHPRDGRLRRPFRTRGSTESSFEQVATTSSAFGLGAAYPEITVTISGLPDEVRLLLEIPSHPLSPTAATGIYFRDRATGDPP